MKNLPTKRTAGRMSSKTKHARGMSCGALFSKRKITYTFIFKITKEASSNFSNYIEFTRAA